MNKLRLVLLLFGVIINSANAQSTIYQTNFTPVYVPGNNDWTTPNSTFNDNNNSTSSGYTGASGSWNLRSSLDNTNPKRLYFQFSTRGYQNITVSYGFKRTSTNASISLAYSTDKTNWTTILSNHATGGSWQLVNGGTPISLPSGADNQGVIYLRWQGTIDGSTGAQRNFRIDDFVAKGTAMSNCSYAASFDTWYYNEASTTNSVSTWSCKSSTDPGGDRIYAITVPDQSPSIKRITVDINSYSNLDVFLVGSTCSPGNCSYYDTYTGSTFSKSNDQVAYIFINGPGTYYIAVDNPTASNSYYDIRFSTSTEGIALDDSGCSAAGYPTDTNNDGYVITWNGSENFTLGNSQNGDLCFNIYLKNTGSEWLKKFYVKLESCWANINMGNSTPNGSNSDFYYSTASGDWNISLLNNTTPSDGDTVIYDFTDPYGNGWGDGEDLGTAGYNCIPYQFCMDLTTASSCSDRSNLNATFYIYDDGISTSNVYLDGGASGGTGANGGKTLPLPVEYLFVKAENKGSYNLIHWATLTETNNDYFILQRSQSGDGWINIDTVEGQGTTHQRIDYTSFDFNFNPRGDFYRLIQVDIDGQQHPSSIVRVMREAQYVKVLSVYPNPATDHFYVAVEKTPQQSELEIIDIQGRVRKTKQLAPHPEASKTYELNTSGLDKGVYIVRLKTATMFRDQKLIIH